MNKKLNYRKRPRPTDTVLIAEFYRKYCYDDVAGTITWAYSGRPAGHGDGKGYRSIMLLGQKYKLHRIVWMLAHGGYPDACLDHINGDRSDNRLINLRLATDAQNVHNRIKTGKFPTGVYKGPRGRYIARIQIPGRQRKINLGRWDTAEEAHKAYTQAAEILHGVYAAHLSQASLRRAMARLR